MASSFSIKKRKAFTLLEMMVVILLFSFVVLIVTSIYLSLVNTSLIANDYSQALENIRLGTEKIWRTLKYGWSFQLIGDGISFQKKDCTDASLTFDRNNGQLIYWDRQSGTSSVFDPNLVKVKNMSFALDRPRTNQTYAYFQYAPKIILISYDLEMKSTRGVTTTLVFEQGVAPLNSVYSTNLCE